MFKRSIEAVIKSYAKLPIVAVLGPRQSGKTTLVKKVFTKYQYLSFEDPAIRHLAEQDPRLFLRQYENKYGIILDEFQLVPQVLSYIQLEVDEKDRPGYFVLTGSQNFLMNEAITQSLAGRVGLLTLFPLSFDELTKNKISITTPDKMIINGCYPRLYDKKIEPSKLYPGYIHSYVERDVRQLVNVGNLRTFQTFLQLCAGRVGQLLKMSEIADACSISASTVQQWLSILEASYIIFILKPHFKNFNRRLTKTPKLYFYDTGLACSLLGIRTEAELFSHPLRGALFENMVMTDLQKQFYNKGMDPSVYFWRDQNGRTEVDCIIQLANALVPLEIKSGETIRPDFFSALVEWNNLAGTDAAEALVVYGGDSAQTRSIGKVMSWKKIGKIVSTLYS